MADIVQGAARKKVIFGDYAIYLCELYYVNLLSKTAAGGVFPLPDNVFQPSFSVK